MPLETKDKRVRITIRMNEELFYFIKEQGDSLGVSPSEYIRLALMSAKALCKATEKKKGAFGRENDEAIKFD